MAGSRSLVACCLAVAAAVFAEDAEEVIGELFIGPARSEHPHWEPIHRERSAPQPVRTTPAVLEYLPIIGVSQLLRLVDMNIRTTRGI